jgi:hypothetical protein
MVFALHKFKHCLLGNKFVFYANHMALVYLVNKSKVLRKITKWLLLFLEHYFILEYKPSKNNVVANACANRLMSYKLQESHNRP